ncbi:hypothetical protein IGI04_008739 [Brassica rapa subsp. trilocularis]|uniref:Phosphatidic acid phosphatase type 2/haloperoxidase domain-containing protein n=1 Tax=Brassica rapa subsp. trilocularis TaxID=1813537 RepID=A0ABQ7NQN8_BRACM|nr:hypothetical protein IGI04_008739 [Brassica rapa subsp. trilocularis]
MAAAAASSLALFHKPTCSFYLGPSSIFPLNRRRLCSFSAPPPKTMADLVKTHAWRDIDGEEGFQALEQEGFTPSNDLVSGGINAVANRLSKWVVAAVFGSVLLLRHDGAALWAVIGSVSNSALSVALKRILNQQRPVATLRSDPGMPSSHAQSISFITLFSEASHRQSSGGGCNRGLCLLHLVAHNLELTCSPAFRLIILRTSSCIYGCCCICSGFCSLCAT